MRTDRARGGSGRRDRAGERTPATRRGAERWTVDGVWVRHDDGRVGVETLMEKIRV